MPSDAAVINKFRYNVLFESVDESILNNVLSEVKELQFKEGNVIFNEESSGNCLYLILSGGVKLCTKTKTGDEATFAILHDGDFFGDLELIDNRPRSATAIAHSDCSLATLGKDAFNTMLKSSHQFTLNLLRMLSLRLRSINQTFILNIEKHTLTAQQQVEKMNKLIEATQIVNSTLDTDKLLGLILYSASSTVEADRGTLYLVDETKNELWSKVAQGSETKEIRLPVGKGIAGYVAATGETINIPDAYADSRFNPEIDKATGYRTKTILCMPMKNKDGKIIGVFQLLNKAKGIFTKDDIEFINALSLHASIAIENARLAQQMVSTERLSAVGKMAGTIIHDIKNPMGTVRLYAQVIQGKAAKEKILENADEIKNNAQEIVRQIDRFVAMTQEILDFSRGVSAMNIQEIEFGDLIDGVLLFIGKDLTRRNVKLVQNMSFTGTVKVDQDKLMRVFFNIAGNAADAMPNGGQLTVTTVKKDGMVVIDFTDTGSGMPPEVKAKIFEPFMTYGKKHGTGLGMAIVKKILDDHKGKIEIESEMGKGTTVRLFLPL